MSQSVMSTLWQYAYLVARKKVTFERSIEDCRALIESRTEGAYSKGSRKRKEKSAPEDITCPLFTWTRLAQRLENDLFGLGHEGSLIREQVGQVFHTFVQTMEGYKLRLTHEKVHSIEEPPGLLQAIMYAKMTNQKDLHVNVLREWAISLKLVDRNNQALHLASSACEGFKYLLMESAQEGHTLAKESYRYWGLDTAKHFAIEDYIRYFDVEEGDVMVIEQGEAYKRSGMLLEQGLEYFRQGLTDEALLLFQEALEIAQQHQNLRWGKWAVAASNYNIANCHSQQGNFDRAFYHYQLALTQFKAMNAMDVYCEVLFNFGALHAQSLQMKKAKEIWEECIELGKKFNPGQASKAIRHLERFDL